jgi:hypothetical protein
MQSSPSLRRAVVRIDSRYHLSGADNLARSAAMRTFAQPTDRASRPQTPRPAVLFDARANFPAAARRHGAPMEPGLWIRAIRIAKDARANGAPRVDPTRRRPRCRQLVADQRASKHVSLYQVAWSLSGAEDRDTPHKRLPLLGAYRCPMRPLYSPNFPLVHFMLRKKNPSFISPSAVPLMPPKIPPAELAEPERPPSLRCLKFKVTLAPLL